MRFPILRLFEASLFRDTATLKSSQLINLQGLLSVQVKGKVACLPLNQKLETIKLHEEGMSKAETGQKLGLLCQAFSQLVNTKEHFLRGLENATPVNAQVIRKRHSLIADLEKV